MVALMDFCNENIPICILSKIFKKDPLMSRSP